MARLHLHLEFFFFLLPTSLTPHDSTPPTLLKLTPAQGSLIPLSFYWIICCLLTKKEPQWFIPPTVFTGHGWLTHFFSFFPPRKFQEPSSNPLSPLLQIKRELWTAKPCHVNYPHFVILVSSCARQSFYSESKHGGGGGRKTRANSSEILKPSSHCSINTDILRMTVPVIKACQSGNYLLLSGLPVVILLKPIPPYFICSLCEFLSVEPR